MFADRFFKFAFFKRRYYKWGGGGGFRRKTGFSDLEDSAIKYDTWFGNPL
jgi:hypothetical protein